MMRSNTQLVEAEGVGARELQEEIPLPETISATDISLSSLSIPQCEELISLVFPGSRFMLRRRAAESFSFSFFGRTSAEPTPVTVIGLFEGVKEGVSSAISTKLAVQAAQRAAFETFEVSRWDESLKETPWLLSENILAAMCQKVHEEVANCGREMRSERTVPLSAVLAVLGPTAVSIVEFGECSTYLWRKQKLIRLSALIRDERFTSARLLGDQSALKISPLSLPVDDEDLFIFSTLPISKAFEKDLDTELRRAALSRGATQSLDVLADTFSNEALFHCLEKTRKGKYILRRQTLISLAQISIGAVTLKDVALNDAVE